MLSPAAAPSTGWPSRVGPNIHTSRLAPFCKLSVLGAACLTLEAQLSKKSQSPLFRQVSHSMWPLSPVVNQPTRTPRLPVVKKERKNQPGSEIILTGFPNQKHGSTQKFPTYSWLCLPSTPHTAAGGYCYGHWVSF